MYTHTHKRKLAIQTSVTVSSGVVMGRLATTAATVAFLIARYLARDKIMSYAQRSKRFAAVVGDGDS